VVVVDRGRTARITVTAVSAAAYITPGKLRLNGEGNLNGGLDGGKYTDGTLNSGDFGGVPSTVPPALSMALALFINRSHSRTILRCSHQVGPRKWEMAIRYVWVCPVQRGCACTYGLKCSTSTLINYFTTVVVSPKSFLTISRSSFRTGVLVPPQSPISRLAMLDQR